MAAKSAPDTDRLTAFLGRFVGDLGATVAAGGVVIGGLARAARRRARRCEMFFRPGYLANLVPSWIRALDGAAAKLNAGAAVADVGCGLGLPRHVGEAGPQARRRGGRGRPHHLRGRHGAGLRRVGLRPGHHVRLRFRPAAEKPFNLVFEARP